MNIAFIASGVTKNITQNHDETGHPCPPLVLQFQKPTFFIRPLSRISGSASFLLLCLDTELFDALLLNISSAAGD